MVGLGSTHGLVSLLGITNRYLVPDAMLSSVFNSQSSRNDDVGLLELRSRSDKVRGKCQM